MSDCRLGAMDAQHPIRGFIQWDDGIESELHYARYVNGHERKAVSVEVDGELFVRMEEGVSLIMEDGAIVAVELDGVRYERERTCEMERTYVGEPCSDWKCSACGKIQTAHNGAKLGECCPRCGAKVVDVVAGVRA